MLSCERSASPSLQTGQHEGLVVKENPGVYFLDGFILSWNI